MAHEELKQKIVELEEEISTTKYNKRTEAAVGLLKAKLARLKEELEVKISIGKAHGEGFAVKKEGDATVGLLGKPSVGKSTLLSKVTNKESKIAAYEFTTLDVIPGLLHHKHTNLQILDLPGIIEKASDNRGFGKKVLSVVRACDLVVLVIDVKNPLGEIAMILDESYKAGLRLNMRKPNFEIKRMPFGSVSVPLNNSEDTLPYEVIKQVVNDQKMINAEVVIHEKGLTIQEFIDCAYNNLEFKKAVICLNKIDLKTRDELKEMVAQIKEKYPQFPIFGVSAEQEINLKEFKDFMWKHLDFIWVYLKEQRKAPDMEKPMVLKVGSTIETICNKLHKDFVQKFKYARICGPSAKFEWQRVGLEHEVQDTDVVEIYAR